MAVSGKKGVNKQLRDAADIRDKGDDDGAGDGGGDGDDDGGNDDDDDY